MTSGTASATSLGTTSWFTIDQARIDLFARATEDPDPMHVDPEWSAKHSPFRTTIPFGFLTASMLTYFSHQALGWLHDGHADNGGYALNYGFNRLRFIAPVPVTAGSGPGSCSGIASRFAPASSSVRSM